MISVQNQIDHCILMKYHLKKRIALMITINLARLADLKQEKKNQYLNKENFQQKFKQQLI